MNRGASQTAAAGASTRADGGRATGDALAHRHRGGRRGEGRRAAGRIASHRGRWLLTGRLWPRRAQQRAPVRHMAAGCCTLLHRAVLRRPALLAVARCPPAPPPLDGHRQLSRRDKRKRPRPLAASRRAAAGVAFGHGRSTPAALPSTPHPRTLPRRLFPQPWSAVRGSSSPCLT